MARSTLSTYKWKRLAEEALRNSLRLHMDSMLLHEYESYPSAFQLSVLALEELSKAKMVSHYYYASITNDGFPDSQFEQDWLKLLYSHADKQWAFVARDMFDYSPKFVRFIQAKALDLKKQQATYVGLERVGKRINVEGRLSIPDRIKAKDSKQLITFLNDEYLAIYDTVCEASEYFGIQQVDDVLNPGQHQFVFAWPYKSGLRGRHFLKQHLASGSHGKVTS